MVNTDNQLIKGSNTPTRKYSILICWFEEKVVTADFLSSQLLLFAFARIVPLLQVLNHLVISTLNLNKMIFFMFLNLCLVKM